LKWQKRGSSILPAVHISYEDTSGKDFFKGLIKRLKDEKWIRRDLSFSYRRLQCFCNPKISRIMRAAQIKYDPTRFIITCDGDGRALQKERQMEKHVDSQLKSKTVVIVIDTEIEEWICISKGYSFSGKPSKFLERKIGYKKRNLPKYFRYLDIDCLFAECNSFRLLVESLRTLNDY
jgi:hypothetical protein